jgi:peptide/nickel transport system substrate-binding protein
MTTLRAIVSLLPLLVLVIAPAAAQETPRQGGILKAAMIGEPPTLDTHTTTATIAYQIAWHVFETLYTYDAQYQPVPHLAESHAVSDGGRRYTITLRKGVKFHNGKELVASDAAASVQRWGRLHTTGKTMFKSIEAVEAKDPHVLVIHLKEPSGSLLYSLASPYLAIHPKSVLDAAGDQPVKEYIGTGPFRFVEHKPDRHIRVARFKEYAARADAANGLGGRRTAYVDEIRFIVRPVELVVGGHDRPRRRSDDAVLEGQEVDLAQGALVHLRADAHAFELRVIRDEVLDAGADAIDGLDPGATEIRPRAPPMLRRTPHATENLAGIRHTR